MDIINKIQDALEKFEVAGKKPNGVLLTIKQAEELDTSLLKWTSARIVSDADSPAKLTLMGVPLFFNVIPEHLEMQVKPCLYKTAVLGPIVSVESFYRFSVKPAEIVELK